MDATVPGWPEEISGGQPKAANDHTGKEEGGIEDNNQEVIGDLGDDIVQADKEAPPDSHHEGKKAQALPGDPFQAERKHAGHVLVFCDEKQFTVDRSFNKRNDRYLEKDRANVPTVFRTKKPASVMVFGLVTSEGKKMPLHFFGTKEKVNTKVYLELLTSKVMPWLEENVEGPYIFIQDSAPAHKAKKTLKLLADRMHTFWEPTTWPSNSPDLNVLDYYM